MESVSEIDLLNLRIADLRTALAQTTAKLQEAMFEIAKLRLARSYGLVEGETISIDTGAITRKLSAVP